MARKKKSQKKPRRSVRPLHAACPFCEENRLPSYKNAEELKNYITDRGKIVSRARSGVCAKHQRRLAREIKRARHIALLPFIVTPT